MDKMLVKDALKKIIYKATIMTYDQCKMSSSGICIKEGYSSDLRGGAFAECEVEHIDYDNYRKRVAILVEKDELRRVLTKISIEDLKIFLKYNHGYSFYKDTKDKEVIEVMNIVINNH